MARKPEARFDTLIAHRERETDRRTRAVAVVIRELNGVQDQRERLEEIIRSEAAGRALVPGERVDLRMSEWAHRRHATLRSGIAECQMRQTQLNRELATRRADLVVARQEQRAAEVIKERMLARRKAEEQRRERVELDEIAVLRHGRSD